MTKNSQYNRVHNALNTAKDLDAIGDNEWQHVSTRIDFARTEQELEKITQELAKKINVNRHNSKTAMIKFLATQGYRPLQSDDQATYPLVSYVYQKANGLYSTVYVVAL
jgi:hypothetical protein